MLEEQRKITLCALPCKRCDCGPVQDANLTEQATKLAFPFLDPAQKSGNFAPCSRSTENVSRIEVSNRTASDVLQRFDRHASLRRLIVRRCECPKSGCPAGRTGRD